MIIVLLATSIRLKVKKPVKKQVSKKIDIWEYSRKVRESQIANSSIMKKTQTEPERVSQKKLSIQRDYKKEKSNCRQYPDYSCENRFSIVRDIYKNLN